MSGTSSPESSIFYSQHPWVSIPMNIPNPAGAPSTRPSQSVNNVELTVRQQPERAKVVVKGKDKDRKPIDPPPILQLKIYDDSDLACHFLHNPYYFCCCTLYKADEDKPVPKTTGEEPKTLLGQLCSSLYRLKDLDNTEGGYFIFSDVSAGVQGKFRLQFCLYELRPEGDSVFLASVMSDVFEVSSAKDWDGVKESTMLSRSFSDQGVRLRLRKESRNAARRAFSGQQSRVSNVPQTPIRPVPSQTASYASHSSSQETETQGEQSAKRRRTSYPSSSTTVAYSSQPPAAQAYANYYNTSLLAQGYSGLPQSGYASSSGLYGFTPSQRSDYATSAQPQYSTQSGLQRTQQSAGPPSFPYSTTSPTSHLTGYSQGQVSTGFSYTTSPVYGSYTTPTGAYHGSYGGTRPQEQQTFPGVDSRQMLTGMSAAPSPQYSGVPLAQRSQYGMISEDYPSSRLPYSMTSAADVRYRTAESEMPSGQTMAHGTRGVRPLASTNSSVALPPLQYSFSQHNYATHGDTTGPPQQPQQEQE